MSIWIDHIKATRKKCPELSYKEAMIEAKKTYNKNTKKTAPVVCKSSKSLSLKSKGHPKSKRKSRKTKKSPRKSKGKGRKSAKGKRRTAKYKKKVPKKFKCKLYPNAPDC